MSAFGTLRSQCHGRGDRLPRQRAAHSGQALVLFALFSFVLIGFMALAVDGGFILAERRQVQSAADAAALAAVISARDGGAWAAAATAYGTQNAGAGSVVTPSRPPASGPYAGDNNYIQVTVSKPVQQYFVGAIYSGAWEVTATATAGIEAMGFNAAMLAVNPSAGGIQTSGYTSYTVNGGSIVSNYRITTSGNTSLIATENIVADDGFFLTGGNNINPAQRREGPEVPDPLNGVISPPTLPAFPGNPVPTVAPTATTCPPAHPGWWPILPASDYYRNPGRFTNCTIGISGVLNGDYRFNSGDWRFDGGGVSLSYERVRFEGGRWNFNGGSGITVNGQNSSNYFEMRAGQYSFTGGASINIGGNAPNNILGGGGTTTSSSTFYFTGGGGIVAGGYNHITLNPGTYIFDGGPGINMSGNVNLTFNSGNYAFYFRNGAGMRFSGGSRIVTNGNPYVRAYFYGSGSESTGWGCPSGTWSDLCMSGNTNMTLPSGEYYFDRGRFLNNGSSAITGTNVFLYFQNGGYLQSIGSATYAFTGPTSTLYTGYYPRVFIYSHPSNTATFTWQATMGAQSNGIIYLPSSPMVFGGAANPNSFVGQIIADRFLSSGNTAMSITFQEYVEMAVPAIYLVQ